MQEAITSQGIQAVTRSQKTHGNEFSPRASRRSTDLLILWFCSPVKPILHFWSPELQENKFLLFSASKFMVVWYSSNRKLIYLLFTVQFSILASVSCFCNHLGTHLPSKSVDLYQIQQPILACTFHYLEMKLAYTHNLRNQHNALPIIYGEIQWK